MKNEDKKDIFKYHRYLPKISTSSKIFMDKKRKQKSRIFLNDKRNWDN